MYNRNYCVFKTLFYMCEIETYLVMKTLSALVYICRAIYCYVHVYMLMIYLCLYFLCRISSLYNWGIIRLHVADVYSCCNRSHSQGNSSIFPCVNSFIGAFEHNFVFICWLSFCYYFIYHSIIVIDSSSVFTDEIFIYLRLFALTYISPIHYVIYRQYHVSTKN